MALVLGHGSEWGCSMSVEAVTKPQHRGLGAAWTVLGPAASLQLQGQTSAPWTAEETRQLTQQSHALNEHPTCPTPQKQYHLISCRIEKATGDPIIVKETKTHIPNSVRLFG